MKLNELKTIIRNIILKELSTLEEDEFVKNKNSGEVYKVKKFNPSRHEKVKDQKAANKRDRQQYGNRLSYHSKRSRDEHARELNIPKSSIKSSTTMGKSLHDDSFVTKITLDKTRVNKQDIEDMMKKSKMNLNKLKAGRADGYEMSYIDKIEKDKNGDIVLKIQTKG